ARAAWIASLPSWIQAWGELLFFLGLSRLWQSLWLWLPLGLLLLNSLIALADYLPGSRRRLGPASPSLDWQHPLAQRAEHSARLPESPDKFLDALKELLEIRDFYLYESDKGDQRLISAVQWRWGWLGPVAFYAGLIGLIIALLVSQYFLQIESLTLLPLEPQPSSLFKGEFTLTDMGSEGVGSISYLAGEADRSPALLTWRLYQPALFDKTLILPLAIDPILTIEARDTTGALLRLIPSQENLLPAERLHLSLDEANSPLYFLIPSAGLAFQILPDSANNDSFNVQIRRSSELSPSAEIKAQAGQVFDVDGVAVTLSPDSSVRLMAYHDPAAPLYLISLVLVAASLLSFWQPPLQLWLIPEVKGRGGQLYGVVEKFGSVAQVPNFLDQLLSAPASPATTSQTEEKDSPEI
ncbi:MAG: cytochrome c biogenesis protein ResB, partial [Chloroflexi bacterium]|nr:cytochrome c biogenesis protein ResB [Chloroflexota bacterium]